ncbi:MAG: hypothetical protein GEU82_05000 [Luteitalea sp.]|nr:hypothetical protein [Luteitalea sp.]
MPIKVSPWCCGGNETRAELELIQQDLHVQHPFISENGGGVFLPSAYFPVVPSGARRVAGYDVLEFGKPYHLLTRALHEVANKAGIAVLGFSDMSVPEVADDCQLSLAQARLAKLREYDEPFRLVEPKPPVQSRLFTAFRRVGLRCFTHGRYHYLTSVTDKTESIRTLTSLYRQTSERVLTIGLAGDSSDIGLLQAFDIPLVVQNGAVDVAQLMRKVPSARFTSMRGSQSWSEAIRGVVNAE